VASDLSFDPNGAPPASEALARVTRALRWESPRLPGLRSAVPRWAGTPTWTPPGTIVLVRHRSLGGDHRVVTNDRRPPDGFAIEFDLGSVHLHAQPGTNRLFGNEDGYAITRIEGEMGPSEVALGWIEAAPFPLLNALEVRRLEDGALTLVAGQEDPLFRSSQPVSTLGYIEPFPIEPRRRQALAPERGFGVLLRSTDAERWRHHYESAPAAAFATSAPDRVSLGGLLLEERPDYVTLSLRNDGTLVSSLLAPPQPRRSIAAPVKWALAPMRWSEGPLPRLWSLRAAAGRGRRLRDGIARGQGPGHNAVLGYLRPNSAPGWEPLYSSHHPALPDQYVTRSQLEATDLGFVVDGVLGYALRRLADDGEGTIPQEIPWGSRFGQRRRWS
jgi:hypothetical protein